MFPKRNEYGFVSESFILKWQTFTPLVYKKKCRLKQIFFLALIILTKYITSAVIVVSSNPST